MAYPTLEQYNEALQNVALSLRDPALKQAKVRTSGLDIPLALCGGFALTYSLEVSGRRYALRCFHKESPELERRYKAVADRLRQLASPYFLPFDFLPDGILVQGRTYPVVRMAWAEGETLSEFLEREHGNSVALIRLRSSLATLGAWLERERVSHGDIQPGNLMVADQGATVRLIDYDGMYVDALAGSRATELGQRNFQHPGRTAAHFAPTLDRFSFLALDTALAALIHDGGIWRRSLSEPEAIVFRAQDFASPAASPVFADIARLPALRDQAVRLGQVAVSAFADVPTLSDFLAGRNIPGQPLTLTGLVSAVRSAYQGAYAVLNGTSYEAFAKAVGDKVELIGQIVGLKRGIGKNSRPYIFLNFADWQGNAVKVAIWSDAFALLAEHPDESWKGRWVSMTGLVDAPFKNTTKRGISYTHISLTLTQRGQLQVIAESEARFRLLGTGAATSPKGIDTGRNADILEKMGTTRGTAPRPAPTPAPAPAPRPTPAPVSSNQAVLDQMRKSRAAPTPTATQRATPPPKAPASQGYQPQPVKRGNGGALPWIIGIIVVFSLLRACAH